MKDFLLKTLKKPMSWALLALAIAAATIAAQASVIRKQKAETVRLQVNQEALLSEVKTYQDKEENLVTTVNALTLRRDELENLVPEYAQEIDRLKIKLKEVQSTAHVALETIANLQATTAPVQDAPPPPDLPAPQLLIEAPREFNYKDTWITVSGRMFNDSIVDLSIIHKDSLTLVAHRTKKKCLRRSKIIKYDVLSKSPYTSISDVNYIELTE